MLLTANVRSWLLGPTLVPGVFVFLLAILLRENTVTVVPHTDGINFLIDLTLGTKLFTETVLVNSLVDWTIPSQ